MQARQHRARHPALPQSRTARTLAAVAAALATTTGGHLIATGAAPPLTGLLLAVAVMAVSAWLLARDERGWEPSLPARTISSWI
jgi:uncharacterized membrane protein YphA (DoxX/SURF4 family)